MSEAYKEITLGPGAVDYIRDRLAEGKTLAKFLLDRTDLDTGKVSTFLPFDADLSKVNNFSRGGVLPTPPPETHHHFTAPDGTKTVMVPVPGTSNQLGAIIQEFLKQGDAQICLFESAVAKPTDGFLSTSNAKDLRVLTFQEDVYCLLKENDDPEKIEKSLRYAKSFLVFGVLVHLSDKDKVLPLDADSPGKELTLDELKVLAEETEKIVVGAYDGEGYLIWSRHGL
jgi:hypothetical protein